MTQTLPGPDGKLRCAWCLSTPEYIAYHDDDWGLPIADDQALFERLSLEAFQSGLSWRIILEKRDSFRAALLALGQGERWLPEGMPPDEGDSAAEAVARLAHLTRQQAKILELLCMGRLNKQIAWELSIAETTVKAHVTAIMRKLGVQSRTQAVLIAQQVRFANFVPEG